MDVPILSIFLRLIFTVALVSNTGENGDIHITYFTMTVNARGQSCKVSCVNCIKNKSTYQAKLYNELNRF